MCEFDCVWENEEYKVFEFDCVWEQVQEDSRLWQTTCQHVFALEDGTPADNGFCYCCYCGGKLIQQEWPDEQEDDE